MALSAPGILLVALAPREAPIPFLIASGFLTGLSAVVYNINQVSFRQAITPTAMQGRMNATMRFIVWGTIPIGAIIGGAIATAVEPVDGHLGRRHRLVPGRHPAAHHARPHPRGHADAGR